MKIYSDIFFPLLESHHYLPASIYSYLTYFYHLTEFFNVRNYFVSPAVFSKLSKHRCIIFWHSFMMTRWANTRITATKEQLVVNKIRLSIQSGTQPQQILCSYTGTGQCTSKNVANTKLKAHCLSQPQFTSHYKLAMLRTTLQSFFKF